MESNTTQFLLVADAHLTEPGDSTGQAFFELLEAASRLPGSVGVVFLGDILELWVAAGKEYESQVHWRFRAWCREQVSKRDLIFLEGNHEFYVSATEHGSFTHVSDASIRVGTLCFTHGDTINAADYKFRLLRRGIRNPLSLLLTKLSAPFFGPSLADRIRRSLKQQNMYHKTRFPEPYAMAFLESWGRRGVKRIILGHFHARLTRRTESCVMEVIPAFCIDGEAAWLESPDAELAVAPWRDLPPFRNLRSAASEEPMK